MFPRQRRLWWPNCGDATRGHGGLPGRTRTRLGRATALVARRRERIPWVVVSYRGPGALPTTERTQLRQRGRRRSEKSRRGITVTLHRPGAVAGGREEGGDLVFEQQGRRRL